ncbi:hypothetical protein FQR65_LT08891 [Abscondita terminalis]|nr:hypothetical protein FQR65_LT08891 [Abscondita terminalis]
METSLTFIQTKSSMQNDNVRTEFEAKSYTSYKRKEKKDNEPIGKNVSTKNKILFDAKKARHEILKFGMSGFDQQKKQEAKIQLAIKLGAKPPKKVYKNYKELTEERKQQKIINNQHLKLQQLGKNEFGESLVKCKKFNRKRKILKGSLLEGYGTVKVKNKK